MQYTIQINQLAICKHFPDFDLKDAAIIDFLKMFFATQSAKRHHLHDKGSDFYWISYDKLIDEMPLLGIKNALAMKRRVDKIVNAGILVRHPDCSKLSKSYFSFTKESEVIWKAVENDTPTPKSIGVKETTPVPESIEVGTDTPILESIEVLPNPYTGKYIPPPILLSVGNQHTSINQPTNYQLTNSPNGVFSDENLEDFEKQLSEKAAQEKFEQLQQERERLEAEKAEAELKAKQESEKKKIAAKKKSEYQPKTHTVSLMKDMATDFDSAFVFVSGQTDFLKFGTVDGEGMQWGGSAGKEFGSLKHFSVVLAKRLKDKNGYEAKPEEIRESWRMFLQMAIDTKEKFILTNFTPSILFSQFNQIILKIQQSRNGKKFGNTNGAASLMSERDFNQVTADLMAKYSQQSG